MRSWVEGADDPTGDFPIENLPLGVFRRGGEGPARIGVAIGRSVLDLRARSDSGLLGRLGPEVNRALGATTLNELLGAGRTACSALRRAATELLGAVKSQPAVKPHLVPMDQAAMALPVAIGDYSDFYASIHHATNVGTMMRPDNPLLPNYQHVPIGYHGRSSSIVVSGTPVKRPRGQTMADGAAAPVYGPSRLLDYEMELGFFVGPGNRLGEPITMARAGEHIAGMVIVNDWSARDVQKWEYQPLGPFLAKNFATTISPWVVSLEALEPFRAAGPPRPPGDPPPLDYLKPAEHFAFDLTVEVSLTSETMRRRGMTPMLVSRGGFADMYWTIAQMLVHHTSTGCNMRPGDLLATGTISGASEDSRGCLLERTWRGQKPLTLPDGTPRSFLADGDEVIMRAWGQRESQARIGFGECRGVILPA